MSCDILVYVSYLIWWQWREKYLQEKRVKREPFPSDSLFGSVLLLPVSLKTLECLYLSQVNPEVNPVEAGPPETRY